MQNPQVDIQAQDRCHRIGQTKPVVVYSLITKNTIDDRILYYSSMKKKLETVIIKGGNCIYQKSVLFQTALIYYKPSRKLTQDLQEHFLFL